jgi:hypothetical protein
MVAAKPPLETFAQQMERFGGFTTADGAPAPDDGTPAKPAPDAADAKLAKKAKGKKGKAEPAAKVEGAVAAAAPAAIAAAAPAVDKLEQLKALAAELQMEFDGHAVTVRERVDFREAKQKLNERIELQEREVLQRLNDAKSQFSDKLTKADKIEQAYAVGDFEGLAKLLGAKDWNGLQEEVIARISDPNYKRLQELERKEQEREAERSQREQEQERHTNSARQRQALKQHQEALSEQMKSSTDPLVSAMHDDPQFIAAVIEVQRQNWDGKTTVSPEKAIKIAAKGFVAPLQQHMKNLYDRLQKVFGATPAQAAQAVQAAAPALAAAIEAAPAPKANKTAIVPTGGSDVASVVKKPTTKKERDAEFSRRLREAIAEDDGTP